MSSSRKQIFPLHLLPTQEYAMCMLTIIATPKQTLIPQHQISNEKPWGGRLMTRNTVLLFIYVRLDLMGDREEERDAHGGKYSEKIDSLPPA